jgi:hypothetical protein
MMAVWIGGKIDAMMVERSVWGFYGGNIPWHDPPLSPYKRRLTPLMTTTFQGSRATPHRE